MLKISMPIAKNGNNYSPLKKTEMLYSSSVFTDSFLEENRDVVFIECVN